MNPGRGGRPPPPKADRSALPLLVVDVAASVEIRQRTYWETGDRQVSLMYLNEHTY